LYEREALSILTKAHEGALSAWKKEEAITNRIYSKVATFDDDDSFHAPIAEDTDSDTDSNDKNTHLSLSSDDTSAKNPKKSNLITIPTINDSNIKKPRNIKDNSNKKNRVIQQEINQHWANLMTSEIPSASINNNNNNDDDDDGGCFLHLPSSLLSKQELRYGNSVSKSKSFRDLSSELQSCGYLVILLLQSGRFAGAIYQGSQCQHHKCFQRYTIRKGQGKAQSAQDGKRKPKSMGSQLRRAGEQNLKEDIQQTLKEWAPMLQKASLILVSCPKTMMSNLFHSSSNTAASNDGLLMRDDSTIRKIPIRVGKPTLESVQIVQQVMMKVRVVAISNDMTTEEASLTKDRPSLIEETPSPTSNETSTQNQEEEKDKKEAIIELSPLHTICQNGNYAALVEWLQENPNKVTEINQPAGTDFMTPLHFAAASFTSDNNDNSMDVTPDPAACVYTLLVTRLIDPTILDSRCRPAYFLAAQDKVRDAFRKARATLGEDYCDWVQSKVGAPLSEEAIQQRKDKEAEKRRRKKARQKEKKAQEKLAAEVAESIRVSQLTEQEANAKKGGRKCECCQKSIRGKNNMFKRLDFIYCSTDCVKKHKRELTANAALSRFGG
jgi:hypothetical protein